MEQTWILGLLHAIAAWVPAGRGDWAAARRQVDEAVATTRQGSPAAMAFAEDANAFVSVCRGDSQGVVDATERLQRTPVASSQRDVALFSWPFHRVVALVELGRLDDAEAELQQITARRRRLLPRNQAAVLRAAGQLAAARRDLDRARRYLTEAVEMPHDSVDALERAHALEALGRFLRRRSERRAAVARLQAARQQFQALRAEPFMTRCDDELAACGVHDPASPRPLDPLTPQERVVATLICAGKTNQQAADELVLSAKTISFHLTNVYAKLGVHTRAQLIAAMQDMAEGKPPLESSR
jgi:ATP/maltotriose-dependent transcriptional regulator MalT